MRTTFDRSTGQLVRRTEYDVTVFLPWPALRAYRRSTTSDTWTACQPQFLLPPEPQATWSLARDRPVAVHAEQASHETLAEVERYCAAIPASIRQRVAVYPERHWEVLRWVSESGLAGEELLESNSALAFAVAIGENLSRCESPTSYRQRRHRLAYRAQRELQALLGFPSTERARRSLRKVCPSAVTVERLKRLRIWLADTVISARLAHVSRINAGVMAILEEGNIGNIGPAALEEVARQSDVQAVQMAGRLAEAIRLWRTAGQFVRPPQVMSLNEVRDQQSAMLAKAHHLLFEQITFPSPPIPGTESIVPITSKGILQLEGQLQHNCVADYADEIALGRYAVYRVLRPERATVGLKWVKDHWALDQVACAWNRLPSFESSRAVQVWFNAGMLSLLESRGASQPTPSASFDDHRHSNNGVLPFDA
jgi:hypothetical protein